MSKHIVVHSHLNESGVSTTQSFYGPYSMEFATRLATRLAAQPYSEAETHPLVGGPEHESQELDEEGLQCS